MADLDATNLGAAVRLWIRRTAEPQGPYAIRFEVVDGKGILRVVRPGVLVDPPARPTGFEERLTAAQVNATRFLHVWDGGRRRQAHALTRLTQTQLETMPAERWFGLEFVTEGALDVLVLPSTVHTEPARVDDEPTWPRREMLAELQRELRELESKEVEHDRTEIRSAPLLPPEGPAPIIELAPPPAAEPPPTGRISRAEVVEIVPRAAPRVADVPRVAEVLPIAGVPRVAEVVQVADVPRVAAPLPEPVRPPTPTKPYTSLDAWLNAPIPARTESNGDEEQTILMGGSALAIDRMDGVRESPRPSLPALAPVPPQPDPSAEEHAAIEAGEAPDEDADEFELVAMEAGHGTLEALEAPAADDEREAADGEHPEVTDVGLSSSPESLHRGQITEAVTVIPLSADELAGLSAVDTSPVLAASDGEPTTEPDPYALAPKAEFHERNTTLVRFLRRRIAADRARITALEEQVSQLEARLRA
ncbi:MAG: hypothetical protein V4850_00110 [Myxococcota bacterium]